MLVALVSPYDWSVPGGVQAQVSGLACALVREGCGVLVAAPGPPPLQAPAGGFELVPLGRSIKVPANGSVAPVAPTPASVARCLGALAGRRPDVVHVHEPLAPGPALGAVAFGPRPLLATFHRAGSDWLYRTEGRLVRRLGGRISVMVAVSEAARATAAEVLGVAAREIVVVPNGVELPAGLGSTAEQKESVPIRARHRTPRVAFVGRHEQRKGLGVLLEALSYLDLDIEAEVVGDGPESAGLRERYGHDRRILWRGAVSDAERSSILAGADLFVAPSLRGESFGVVLLEAMAAGAPVLASDLPGYRLAAGETGAARFVPPGDARRLAAEIARLLADPQALAGLRLAGSRRAEERSMDAVARRYLDLYEAAGRAAPRPRPPSGFRPALWGRPRRRMPSSDVGTGP